MKNLSPILLLVIIVFSGCADREKNTADYFKEYAISCPSYDMELYTMFPYIMTFDSVLISVGTEGQNGRIGRIYSINENMKEIGSFGRVGRGPGEFVATETTKAYGNRFQIRNLNMQEVATLEVVSEPDGIKVRETERLKFDRAKPGDIAWDPVRITRIDDDHLVGVIYGGKGAFFSLFNNRMELLGNFGDPLIEGDLAATECRRCLQGELGRNCNPESGCSDFCYVPSDRPTIAYYSMKDGVPQEVWRDTFYDSYYRVDGKFVRYNDEKTVGITHEVVMGNEYIYILFLDVPLSKANVRYVETFAANIVFVYDRKGHRVARLKLDDRIYQMVLSKDQKKMYGVSWPKNNLIEFDLPEFDTRG